MEHESATRDIHVKGTDTFRKVALFGSLIAAAMSFLIKLMNPRGCDAVNLEYAIYMCLAVQIFTFFLLLGSYLCVNLFVKIGRWMAIFYFFLVGAMVGVQIIFFKGQECNRVSPLLYYWLFTNIILFYILVAYGLSLWGAYICWEVDEEERIIVEALKRTMAKNYGNSEFDERIRMAGWIPLEEQNKIAD